MKYLILHKNNTTFLDANNISTAKNILKRKLNKNSINEIFEIIDLSNGNKKYYISKLYKDE
jgi:hypothetical protein